MPAFREIVVAIPARDEQARIGACLRALAPQLGKYPAAILVLLNNCGDDSAGVVARLRSSLPCPIDIVQHNFPAQDAHAGAARRLAMTVASRQVCPGGVLITTDADGRVAPDWIEANLTALEAGADMVCGRAIIDPDEAALIPAHLHADDALECRYAELLDEIHAVFDPDPADPWPRHSENSGASLAVRREAFLQAGGIPAIPSGEDREFVAAMRRIDARIRHAPEVTVTVSGRLDGRAVGGMADTIRRRVIAQDPLLDDRLEPAPDAARRALARHDCRALWGGLHRRSMVAQSMVKVAARLAIPADRLASCLGSPSFGAAWEEVEAASPCLIRRRVARPETTVAIRSAEAILAARLYRSASRLRTGHPAGIAHDPVGHRLTTLSA